MQGQWQSWWQMTQSWPKTLTLWTDVFEIWILLWAELASLVAQMVKNLPAMQETWVLFQGWEDILEEGMATHSSILAWRIPWTEEPGGLQSLGSHRVGHDWSWLSAHTWAELYLPLFPPHSYVELLTPSTSECALIWREDLYRGNEATVSPLGWVLIQNDRRPDERKTGHRDVHRGKTVLTVY